MEKGKLIWEGVRNKRIILDVTEAEHNEIKEMCKIQGGLSISMYMRRLHHKSMGRLKEGDE